MVAANLVPAVSERLREAGCVAATAEARLLVAAAPDLTTLEAWVERRTDGEPLAWITGRHRFGGRSLHVAPGVYVPRPHTEALAARAASLLPAGGRLADLCTGCGAVPAHVSAHRRDVAVVGIDLDVAAARCARRNGVRCVLGDAGAPPLRGGSFDVVTAVAPYVPTGELRFLPRDVVRFEPLLALDGGADGLSLVRCIVVAAARLLRPGGTVLLELGGDQATLIEPCFATHGFTHVEVWRDADGEVRGTGARRSAS